MTLLCSPSLSLLGGGERGLWIKLMPTSQVPRCCPNSQSNHIKITDCLHRPFGTVQGRENNVLFFQGPCCVKLLPLSLYVTPKEKSLGQKQHPQIAFCVFESRKSHEINRGLGTVYTESFNLSRAFIETGP